MKFVVLEGNIVFNKKPYAMIHRASCGFAKEPNYKTASSFCHGYFDTFLEALRFAKSLDVEKVNECTFCTPRYAYKRFL